VTLQSRIALLLAAMIVVVFALYTVAVFELAVEEPDELQESAKFDERTERELAQRQLLLVLGIGVTSSIVVCVGGTVLLTRRSLAPLGEIMRVVRELDFHDLGRRIPEHRAAPSELRELSAAINATLARLERSADGLRRFTADASHELRTPLSRIQGRLEHAMTKSEDHDVAAALEEVHELTRVIESLLLLAHADAGNLVATRASVDACALARDVVQTYEPVAADRGVVLAFEGAQCVAVGDEAAFKRVITNLVDNACKYTSSGGSVAVLVEPRADRVLVTVRDSGPGIASADADRIFERFFRGEQTRAAPGAGLGLALSRDLARAHGGDVRLLPSTSGASFVAEFPRQG
jgi:signal transduction histidine kinase